MEQEQPLVKVKDPKKVERGKKLGAISQMAKSKKRLSEELRKRELESGGYTVFYVLGGVAVLGLGYLYYTKRKPEPVILNIPEPVAVVEPVVKKCSRMVTFA